MKSLLTTIIGILSAAVVCANTPRLTVTVPVGAAPPPSSFIPIRVELQTTAPFEGRLLLFDTAIPDLQVVHNIAVGPGRFRYDTPLPSWPAAQSSEVRVELRDTRGRLVAADTPAVSLASGGGAHLSFGWLMKRQKLDLLSLQMTTTWLQAQDLPADPSLLAALRVIIITDSGAEPLAQPQIDALRTWVASGGRLVIAGDCVQKFVDEHPFLTTFGIVLSERGTSTIPGRVGNEQDLAPATLVWREITTGGVTLRGQDADVRTFGFGSIVLLPACLGELPDPCPPTLAHELEKHLGPRSSELIDGDYRHLYGYLDYPGIEELASIAGVPSLPTPLIALVLIVYVAIAAWAAPRYLRQRQRQNLIWGLSLAIVLVFCVVAQALAMAMRGYHLREVSLVIDNINGTAIGQRDEHLLVIPPNSVSRQLTIPVGARIHPSTQPAMMWNANTGQIEQAMNAWIATSVTISQHRPLPSLAESRLSWSVDHDLLGDIRLLDPSQPWQACLLKVGDSWYSCTLRNGIITPAGEVEDLYRVLNVLQGPFWNAVPKTPASDLFVELFEENQDPWSFESDRTQAELYLLGDNPPRLATLEGNTIAKAGWVVRQIVDIKPPAEHKP